MQFVSGRLFSVFDGRFGAEEKGLAGKWPVSLELRQAWESLGYWFCLVKARQIALQSLLLQSCASEDDGRAGREEPDISKPSLY